jgi:hypothetical protein
MIRVSKFYGRRLIKETLAFIMDKLSQWSRK